MSPKQPAPKIPGPAYDFVAFSELRQSGSIFIDEIAMEDVLAIITACEWDYHARELIRIILNEVEPGGYRETWAPSADGKYLAADVYYVEHLGFRWYVKFSIEANGILLTPWSCKPSTA